MIAISTRMLKIHLSCFNTCLSLSYNTFLSHWSSSRATNPSPESTMKSDHPLCPHSPCRVVCNMPTVAITSGSVFCTLVFTQYPGRPLQKGYRTYRVISLGEIGTEIFDCNSKASSCNTCATDHIYAASHSQYLSDVRTGLRHILGRI